MAPTGPSSAEVQSFAAGMHAMYEFGERTKPDVILFPFRGAGPFRHCYQRIAEDKHTPMPNTLALPVGTYIDVSTDSTSGMTKPEKLRVIRTHLVDFLDRNDEASHILLVDEVLNGGTILQHHNMVRRVLRENFDRRNIALNVCALEKTGNRSGTTRYKGRADRFGFQRIPIDNFIMDKNFWLPVIKRSDDGAYSIEDTTAGLEPVFEVL